MKKLKFLSKLLQNFILGPEIPGRPIIDFWGDYQPILKKHKKVLHENYQIWNNSTFGRIFSQFLRYSIFGPFLGKLRKLFTYFWITNKFVKG